MTQAHQIAPGQPGDKLIFPFWVGGRESSNSNVALAVGAIAFNPLDYYLNGSTPSAYFRVVAANGLVSFTTHVQLYNVTDGEVVTGSDQTFTLTSLVKKDGPLTLGNSAGELKLSEKIYECRIFLDAPPVGAETVELYSAYLMLQNLVV